MIDKLIFWAPTIVVVLGIAIIGICRWNKED